MNELKPIEFDKQRILLTSQIAEMYGTTQKMISNNFNNNKERYQVERDYYCLEGEALGLFLQSANLGLQNQSKIRSLYLWTEHGALLHAKSLGTDQAWEVYGELVDTYFRAREVSVLPQDYPSALRALADQVERYACLQSENLQQKQLLSEFSPKASYYDIVLQTKDVLSASQIAKDYGKSAQWLNDLLHELGVQYKQGGVWLLYQKYAEQGYTKSRTQTYTDSRGQQHSKLHTYFTQKGRLFIYDLLKQSGIVPLMERLEDAG